MCALPLSPIPSLPFPLELSPCLKLLSSRTSRLPWPNPTVNSFLMPLSLTSTRHSIVGLSNFPEMPSSLGGREGTFSCFSCDLCSYASPALACLALWLVRTAESPTAPTSTWLSSRPPICFRCKPQLAPAQHDRLLMSSFSSSQDGATHPSSCEARSLEPPFTPGSWPASSAAPYPDSTFRMSPEVGSFSPHCCLPMLTLRCVFLSPIQMVSHLFPQFPLLASRGMFSA